MWVDSYYTFLQRYEKNIPIDDCNIGSRYKEN